MPSDDSAARVPLGPIGGYVMRNLKQLRQARGLTYKELSEILHNLGRDIPTLGLSRIEKGTRRVDADDLVALAIALCVNPAALLLPRDTLRHAEIQLTGSQPTSADAAWAWMDGLSPMLEGIVSDEDVLDFVRHARPTWAPVPEQLARVQEATRPIPVEETLEQPVATAIVTSELGVLVGRRNDGKPPWTFIAGEVEPGESPADAAIREVKEETGLRVQLADVIGERVHPKTGRTMIYIAAEPTHGTDVFVGDEEELAEVRWVSLAEADDLMAAYGMFEPVHDYLSTKLDGA